METNHRRRNKLPAALVSMVYTVCMLYLLFLRRLTNGRAERIRLSAETYGYRRAVLNNINLVPLRTIRRYYRSWRTSMARDGFNPLNYSFVNNFGNVLIFIPLGVLLPYFWKAQRNPLIFLLTTLLLITGVEVSQGLLLLGTCDIDDLILNMIGSFIGYVLYMTIHLICKKRKPHGT